MQMINALVKTQHVVCNVLKLDRWLFLSLWHKHHVQFLTSAQIFLGGAADPLDPVFLSPCWLSKCVIVSACWSLYFDLILLSFVAFVCRNRMFRTMRSHSVVVATVRCLCGTHVLLRQNNVDLRLPFRPFAGWWLTGQRMHYSGNIVNSPHPELSILKEDPPSLPHFVLDALKKYSKKTALVGYLVTEFISVECNSRKSRNATCQLNKNLFSKCLSAEMINRINAFLKRLKHLATLSVLLWLTI